MITGVNVRLSVLCAHVHSVFACTCVLCIYCVLFEHMHACMCLHVLCVSLYCVLLLNVRLCYAHTCCVCVCAFAMPHECLRALLWPPGGN